MDILMQTPRRSVFSIAPPASEDDWADYYALRWRVLRKPWRQPPGSERDDLDEKSYHLLAKATDGTPVGTGRLSRAGRSAGRVGFMAVEDGFRGKGVGSALLRRLVAHACAAGLQTLDVKARDSAVGFYRCHGFDVVGAGPTLFGSIEHSMMRKSLPNSTVPKRDD